MKSFKESIATLWDERRRLRGRTSLQLAIADRFSQLNAEHWRAVTSGQSLFYSAEYQHAFERFRPANLEARYDSIAPGHNRPMSDWRELPRHHDDQGISINPRTAVTRRDGGPMDFGMAIDSLLYRVRQAKNPPAGG